MTASPTGDVAITGVGTLGAFGIGVPALAQALGRGVIRVQAIPDMAGYGPLRGIESAALCRDLDLGAYVSPARARRISEPSRFALAAACMALADAGLPLAAAPGGVRSVALATTYGAGVYTERLAREILDTGPRSASPFLFTDCVANAPAGQVAIEVGARGPNATIVQREAGAVLALIEARNAIALRRADVALAGHAEEFGPLVHAVLVRLRSLCPADADGQVRPRPFDARRAGFVPGEGATVLVLEREGDARARGVRPLAKVRASVRAFDPTASRAGFGRDAAGLAAALRTGLQRAGIAPADVHGIVASAAGTIAGDRLEAGVMRAVWGEELPPVFAPKAVTGEYGGGNLGAALAILGGVPCARPAGTEQPAFGFELHRGSLPAAAQRILVSGIASGGAAAWIVLEREGP